MFEYFKRNWIFIVLTNSLSHFRTVKYLTDKLCTYHYQYRLLYAQTSPNIEIRIASLRIPSLSGHYPKLYDHTNLITPCSRQEESLERIYNSCSFYPMSPRFQGQLHRLSGYLPESSRWSQTTRWLYIVLVRGYDALLHCSKFKCVTSTEGKFWCVTNTEGLSIRFHLQQVFSSVR